ncbi:MAG: hypothetical protein ABIK92_06510 [Pseudomonadota bacterium]
MDNESNAKQCSDPTKEFKILIPCRLAERVEAYAAANNATITGMVIEALDTFLTDLKNREY